MTVWLLNIVQGLLVKAEQLQRTSTQRLFCVHITVRFFNYATILLFRVYWFITKCFSIFQPEKTHTSCRDIVLNYSLWNYMHPFQQAFYSLRSVLLLSSFRSSKPIKSKFVPVPFRTRMSFFLSKDISTDLSIDSPTKPQSYNFCRDGS